WRLAPSPLNRPALAFGAVSLLAFAWSIAWRDPGLISAPKFIVTQIAAEATILVSLSAMLLVGNFFDTPGKLKYLVGTFLLFGFLMTLSELAKLDHGLLNDRGLWGGWLVACAYGLLIVQPGLSGWWRIALIAVLGLTFFQIMVVNSLWVSGWAPALVALAVITLLRSWKAFIVFVIVGALVFIASRGFFAQVTQDNVDEGALGRLVIYEQSWRILREHPLLGTGPAGYALYYMTYFPDEARSTHNNYLDIVAQFGFVGLGVWAWLMGVSLFEGWRLSRQAPSGFLRTIVIIATAGWAAALFSMVLGDWVLPFAYNQGIAGYSYTVYSWLFLGTLISVRKLSSAMVAEQSQ
ncbi:MAG: O-antigen ligase family protein, partial [Chloroflexales bacterium]|nr:O-antigen ligase family protein [Chloroflexales bacterium]